MNGSRVRFWPDQHLVAPVVGRSLEAAKAAPPHPGSVVIHHSPGTAGSHACKSHPSS